MKDTQRHTYTQRCTHKHTRIPRDGDTETLMYTHTQAYTHINSFRHTHIHAHRHRHTDIPVHAHIDIYIPFDGEK